MPRVLVNSDRTLTINKLTLAFSDKIVIGAQLIQNETYKWLPRELIFKTKRRGFHYNLRMLRKSL